MRRRKNNKQLTTIKAIFIVLFVLNIVLTVAYSTFNTQIKLGRKS